MNNKKQNNKGKILLITLMILIVTLTSAISVLGSTGNTKLMTVSLINQDPDPAIAGDTVEVRLGIENKGSETINNLIVEIEPSFPFSLANPNDKIQEIGTLKAYYEGEDMTVLKFNIKVDKDAIATDYDLNVKFYEEGSNTFIETSVPISIKTNDNVEIINIDKTNILPGEQTDLTFTITNVGGSTLNDLTFSWTNDDEVILPVGSDNTKYIKSLGVGKSVDVKYKVIADSETSPGLYVLNLALKYDNTISGATETLKTISGIYIGGETDFEIAFSEKSGTEMSFTIANIGSNDANSVTVTAIEKSGFDVSGATSEIIGNLNKGDYTVVSYETGTVTANTIDFKIAYTNTQGQRKTIETSADMSSQSNAGNTNGNSTTSRTRSTTTRPNFQGRDNPLGSMSTGLSNLKYVGYGLIVLIVLIVAIVVVVKKRKAKKHSKK